MQSVVGDLVWEVQRVNGRWVMATRDWQALNHWPMRHRLQCELVVLRHRLLEILAIAEALQASCDGLRLAFLTATCRLTLAMDGPLPPMPKHPHITQRLD